MEIRQYRQVQAIAKAAMKEMETRLEPGMPLREAKALCEKMMRGMGADSFWYWDIGAFCFSGDETARSVSGRDYRVSDRRIQEDDIITMDLSPQVRGIWGDYARTIVLEHGKVVKTIGDISNPQWKSGLLMEEQLHWELTKFVRPATTFEELYFFINGLITARGFCNLDFMGNLGHSIETSKEARIYIERGNTALLSQAGLFTFEPHIGRKNSPYGYKREDIYYFSEGSLKRL